MQSGISFGEVKHCTVIGQCGVQHTRLTQACFHLSNVFAVFIARDTPVLPQVIDERHVVGQQSLLGQIGLLKKPPMKRTLNVFGCQQIFVDNLRVWHRHQHSALQQIGPGGAQTIADDGSPILADVMQLFAGRHRLDQACDAMNQTGFVEECVLSHTRGQIAGQVRRDDAVAGLRQRLYLR